ncbi:porin family protein [Pendulispora brunnea]|uniref:Porin family protein n=1 Tax=Pendulispora brunnea TaxID=2905690 RepID=A0ABZ2K2H5_9BACT
MSIRFGRIGILGFGVACVILFAPGSASAQEGGFKRPVVSVGLERVGGVSYSKLTADNSDDSASLTAFGLGSVNVNPYTAPRLGIDYISPVGVTVGGGLGFGHFSLSTKNGSRDRDEGSLTVYTFTPRVGYRIPIGSRFDLTPRAGVTLAGGKLSDGNSDASNGVFAVALSGEAVGTIRLTPSFNILTGLGFDHTVHASTSSTRSSSSGGTTTNTDDIKGALFTAQLWLGVGGYFN